MNCFSQEQLNKISNLVREVEKLSDIERLLLYLQLPCGRTELPEGKYKSNSGGSSSSSSSSSGGCGGGGGNNGIGHKQSQDIFSKKSDQETTQTYTWILSHLEEDPNVSLPKQEVYDDYRAFCQANKFEPLCVADFGKAMKHALPCIKPRRLGQRGNSRYCYSGLRKKYKIEAPSLPDLSASEPAPSQPQVAPQVQTVLRPPAGGSATEHYYPNSCGRESTRLAKSQCRNNNSNPYEYSPQANKNTATVSPPINSVNQQQQQQQQARSGRHDDATNSTAATFMNLKLESCNSNQSQCSAVTSSPPVVLDCCNPSASGHVNPSFNSDNSANSSRISSHGGAGGPGQAASTGLAYHHSVQLNNQDPRRGSHSVVQQPQLIRCEQARHYSQPSFVHRSGTPDDDDYRHNYHDLNRPIVGPAIIPFSQSLTAQLAQQSAPNNGFISYNNNSHPLPPLPPPPPIVNHLPHQQDQHQHQLQHQQEQPHDLGSMGKIADSGASGHLPAGVGQHQQSAIATNSCCQEAKASGGTSTLNLVNNNNSENNHHQRHNIDDEHQYEMSGRTNSSDNNGDRTNCEPTIELPIHNSSDPLHINLSLFNHCSGSNMDYCASPFQSPASTPYPIMSNYAAAPDTQDYYAGECIPYPDQ